MSIAAITIDDAARDMCEVIRYYIFSLHKHNVEAKMRERNVIEWNAWLRCAPFIFRNVVRRFLCVKSSIFFI